MDQDYQGSQIALPNGNVVLTLGIISILTCCCYGVPGLVCGIVALVLAKSSSDLYVSEPGKYTESSYKNLNVGKNLRLDRHNTFNLLYSFGGYRDRYLRYCYFYRSLLFL
jgi:hypothetical protein